MVAMANGHKPVERNFIHSFDYYLAMASTDTPKASKRMIEDTKLMYDGLISKQLDDKSLSRPPFNLIQEIAKCLATEAKILRDCLGPSDLDTGARRRAQMDRRFRLQFVDKLINYAASNGEPVLGCVASRVLAGLEPNKTLELLQSLARIAIKKHQHQKQKQTSNATTSNKPSTTPPSSSHLSTRSSSGSSERPRTFTRRSSSQSTATTNPKQREPNEGVKRQTSAKNIDTSHPLSSAAGFLGELAQSSQTQPQVATVAEAHKMAAKLATKQDPKFERQRNIDRLRKNLQLLPNLIDKLVANEQLLGSKMMCMVDI